MGNDRIAVPGGGSVGLCMAAHFAQAGAEVTLLLRGGRAGEIGDRGFAVSGLLGAHRPEPGAICLAESHAPDARTLSCDMLLVATRACDLAEARGRHAGRLDGRNPVLLPRNGRGTAELARSILGDDVPVYSAAMMIGRARRGPAEVAVTAHAGPLRGGATLGASEAPLAAFLGRAAAGVLPVAHDPAISDTIFFKVLFNSCMNPTAALTGPSYGGLLENPHSRLLVADLTQEALEVFAARGCRPEESGQVHVDGTLSRIIFPGAAGHRSSMLQDIEAGRRTEIDVLNGAIAEMASRAGLSFFRFIRIPCRSSITWMRR